MIEVNETLILKVAELSRLELSSAEIQEYVKSIGEILKHVDQLSEVNVEGVEPMVYGIDDALKLREDRVIEFPNDENGNPKILVSAPETLDNSFKVPQIIS